MEYMTLSPQPSFTPVAIGTSLPSPHVFTPSMQKVVYVMDHELGVENALRNRGYKTAGLSNARELSFQLQSNSAICLVLNLDIPGLDLSSQIEQLRNIAIGLQVVAVTRQQDKSIVRDSLQAGVSDLCLAPWNEAELFECVDHAIERDRSGDPSPSDVRSRLASLTDREREVVEHCLKGTITKVIAKHLDVTYQTIDKHRKKALRKMGIGSMVELSSMLSQTMLRALGSNYEFRA